MGFLTENSINWVLAIQSLGAWLEMPMRFFSFLGDENFSFWCFHFSIGAWMQSWDCVWRSSSLPVIS